MLSNLLWRILGELPLIETSGKTSRYIYGIFILIHKNNMYIYIYKYMYMYNLILYGNLDRYLPLPYVYNPINNGIFSMSMSSCSFFRLRFCTVTFPTMVNVGMSPMMCFEHPGVLCAWLLSWFVVLLFLFCCLLLLSWVGTLFLLFFCFLLVLDCWLLLCIVVYILFVVVISSRVGVLGFEFVRAGVWEGRIYFTTRKGLKELKGVSEGMDSPPHSRNHIRSQAKPKPPFPVYTAPAPAPFRCHQQLPFLFSSSWKVQYRIKLPGKESVSKILVNPFHRVSTCCTCLNHCTKNP